MGNYEVYEYFVQAVYILTRCIKIALKLQNKNKQQRTKHNIKQHTKQKCIHDKNKKGLLPAS